MNINPMKRYQCIKNVWLEPIYPEDGRLLIFRAGDVYQGHLLDNYPEITDDLGNVHLVTDRLLDSFKELEPIDMDDHEAHEYVALQPVHGCLRFIAFGIAISATLGIFIYLALTWRS